MVMMSPYADSLRRNPQLPRRAAQAATMTPQQSGGLGALFRQMGMGNLFGQRPMASFEGRPAPDVSNIPLNAMLSPVQQGPRLPAELSRPARVPAQPANPFEGNEQYQALMDFQKSLAPSEEQQAQLQELQSAFEGTGAFKDYRINQLQNQLQQRNPRMGMGLGGMRPMGMQPYQQFGRPPMMQQPMRRPMPMPRGGYNQYQQQPYYQGPSMNQGPNQLTAMQNQYQQQQYMNPYQQMRPQPQQFGGYGMGQQMGGYGSYGQMPNPYQPQQMGYNPNNFAQNQFQGYGGMQAQSQAVY
jgi:hypothetical protein